MFKNIKNEYYWLKLQRASLETALLALRLSKDAKSEKDKQFFLEFYKIFQEE